VCTVESLAFGDQFGTLGEIADMALAIGTQCTGIHHTPADWDINPQSGAGGWCFPLTGNNRTNQNCDITDITSQRFCTCEDADPLVDYEMVLSDPGENCTGACSRYGYACTIDALVYGDLFGTASQIANTALAVGTSCSGGTHAEKTWDVNPQVSGENYCFPVDPARTTQNCDVGSTLEKNGTLIGHRICTCEDLTS